MEAVNTMNAEVTNKINQYLTQVAEQNPSYLPNALFRASMLRITLRLHQVLSIDEAMGAQKSRMG
jgi:hypothetical protein